MSRSIANNIANINTTSFKRSRAEFTDLFYQMERMQGVPNRGRRSPVPEGAKSGPGRAIAAVRKLHMQGALAQTGNPYDLAVNGRGWFQIAGPNGETLYTRAGAFNTNADRQLVTADGYTVEPAIIIPQGTVEVTVNESGQVYAKLDNEIAPRQLGQLNLANFANEAGLDPLGGNLYRRPRVRHSGRRRPRRSRLRKDPPALSGELERRSRQGNHRADLGPALLRNEFQGDPGGRRDGRRRSPRAFGRTRKVEWNRLDARHIYRGADGLRGLTLVASAVCGGARRGGARALSGAGHRRSIRAM